MDTGLDVGRNGMRTGLWVGGLALALALVSCGARG